MTAQSTPPRQALACVLLVATLAFGIWYGQHAGAAFGGVVWLSPAWLLLAFKTVVELAAAFYGLAFVLTAMTYLLLRSPAAPEAGDEAWGPSVGIIYLCCGDFDAEAFRTLTRLRYPGPLRIIVHDDSRSDRPAPDLLAALDEARREREVLLLRRPEKHGGKPGAVNYVLDRTHHLYEYFLLCDNDSVALDPDALVRTLPYLQDARTAIVQCRNVAVEDQAVSKVTRRLSESIEAFHVFLAVWARFGWRPFVGHNAVLRTAAVREVGGLTPGFFADDLDLTVRLNLAGYRVVYAPHIRFGERQPPSYDALRRRTYKWAYGCMQLLRRWGATVLITRHLTFAEKLGFFQLAGFYVGQSVLLLYLGIVFLLGPLLIGDRHGPALGALVAGSLIVLAVFLPMLAYFARERRLLKSLPSVGLFGLVYGTTDFSCARGVWDCLRRRQRNWVPTNAVASGSRSGLVCASEALFGSLLLAVPLLFWPALLHLPSSHLFAGKFLFTPALAGAYADRTPRRGVRRSLQSAALAVLVPLLLVWTMAAGADRASHESPQAAAVTLEDGRFHAGGQPFTIKGVHYGPWRPGTGPNKGYPYPGREEIAADFSMIQEVGANTVLAFDPPAYLLDAAHEQGLKVLYTFALDWSTLGAPGEPAAPPGLLERVRELRRHPALLGWILGNEIPSMVIVERGETAVVGGLRALYDAIKAIDAEHPVSHSNWPLLKDLELGFFDFASFNLYPLWPPEVVATGYGRYLRDELRPLAAGRPLVVTEFGVNSLEAGEEGQARIIRECWDAIAGADIAGGVVFEFADEWWKHYDNPIRAGSWWDRRPAPDDEARHDLDPEEHYGLVTSDRQPKPAWAAVREMFAEDTGHSSRDVPLVVVTLLAVAAAGAWARYRPGRLPRSPVT